MSFYPEVIWVLSVRRSKMESHNTINSLKFVEKILLYIKKEKNKTDSIFK